MSEPARSVTSFEDDGHVVPSPLRDWLSAMRQQPVSAVATSVEVPHPLRQRDVGREAQPDVSWGPRLVDTAEPHEESSDISELMAENLMLKAKLKVELERQDALQAALAEQIRELRQHIAAEVHTLEELQAEQVAAKAEYDDFRSEREQIRRDRDTLRHERDRIAAERDTLKMEREAVLAEREMLREDRDLWRARAEALAQPIFQHAKR